MTGSGTTLVTARMLGHEAIGFDRDPLAVTIASAWSADVNIASTQRAAKQVLEQAQALAKVLKQSEAYPPNASAETKAFLRYWFDTSNRIQLTALAECINQVRNRNTRTLLWCAFSRLIITKQSGASLAMDTSHSRPHKAYTKAPISALARYEHAIQQVTRCAPFKVEAACLPAATVRLGDARSLPLPDEFVDMVLTSPPYLNAIDYLRGHKFSLVWMGHSIEDLRNLRSTNVGAEVGTPRCDDDQLTNKLLNSICVGSELSSRTTGMLRRYIGDLHGVVAESHRVLKPGGSAVYVIGNCNVRDVFIDNAECLKVLGKDVGFKVRSCIKRPLPENRRYLPPPQHDNAGAALSRRMREEVIITFYKD